jgi:hypothetical protein
MLTIPFILLVLVTFVSLASVLCHLAVPMTLRTLEPVGPALRSHLLLLVAAAPWLIGAGLLISSVADIIFGACDLENACLWNEDPRMVAPSRALVAVPLVLATALFGLAALWRSLTARNAMRALERVSTPGADPVLRFVPGSAALAFAGHGRIYISDAVHDALAPELFDAVLLHERAHLQRHDGFFQTLASVLAASYLPPIRRRILRALAMANEQACDEQAARVVGRTAVASAIVSVERMRARASAAACPGFADNFVTARIHRLLDIAGPGVNTGRLMLVFVLILMSAFLVGDVLYYLAMMILYPWA